MAEFPEQKEKELQELTSYVSFWATEVWGIPQDSHQHPSHVMKPVPGKMSKSQLLSGVRQAARDTIEASKIFKPEKVEQIDNACRSNLVLTLSEIRKRYGR